MHSAGGEIEIYLRHLPEEGMPQAKLAQVWGSSLSWMPKSDFEILLHGSMDMFNGYEFEKVTVNELQ